MQAFKEPPPDMVCKDKFLIQSTAVPEETTDEDITASMVTPLILYILKFCYLACQVYLYAHSFIRGSSPKRKANT